VGLSDAGRERVTAGNIPIPTQLLETAKRQEP